MDVSFLGTRCTGDVSDEISSFLGLVDVPKEVVSSESTGMRTERLLDYSSFAVRMIDRVMEVAPMTCRLSLW